MRLPTEMKCCDTPCTFTVIDLEKSCTASESLMIL